LLSRDKKEENIAFVSRFIGESMPNEERFSDTLDDAKQFAQSNQTTILLANPTSLYLCVSPGYFLYSYNGITKRTKRIAPEKFTLLRVPYTLLSPDHRILVTAEPIKDNSNKLESILGIQSIANTSQLDSAREAFSLNGPRGILSVRTRSSQNSDFRGTTGSIVSNRGQVRPVNEDSGSVTGISYSDGSKTLRFTLVVVADGVGGLEAGEIASKLAVSTSIAGTVSDIIHQSSSDAKDSIKKAFDNANEKIVNATSFTNKAMGSTLSMTLLIGAQLYAANAGDTRIYLIRMRDRTSQRLTVDHRFLENGVPTHVITRALGSRDPSPDINGPYDCEEELRLVTCTDGVHEDVNDNEIMEQTVINANPKRLCENLVRLANSRGGKDNLTVAALYCNGLGIS
jgi:PPM family protein phosphatase